MTPRASNGFGTTPLSREASKHSDGRSGDKSSLRGPELGENVPNRLLGPGIVAVWTVLLALSLLFWVVVVLAITDGG